VIATRRLGLRWPLLLLLGCAEQGSGDFVTGTSPQDQLCPGADYLTVLPVDRGEIVFASVIGGLSPPAHTLPSDHGGLYLAHTGVTLRAPARLTVLRVRRTHYLASPFRTGAQDFALELSVCSAIQLSIGHITSLSPALAALIEPGGCSTYSTANETVEACLTAVSKNVDAGEVLGTVGGPTAAAFDFGVYDRRHHNQFANPARFASQQVGIALCPWEPFTPDLRALLLARVGNGSQLRMGDPACGSVEVDRVGTAQGMWIRESLAGSAASGDESPFVTLTYDLVRPNDKLLFSIGVPTLGAGAYSAPIAHEGLRNRAFGEVLPGAVHCYDVTSGLFYPEGAPRISFLLALADPDHLRLERREIVSGCDGDPSTWSFSERAITFVR
jgi:hypothetical protein